MDPTQFKHNIDLAIIKYAPEATEDDRDDLRQSCYLVLLRAGSKVTTPGHAYIIARNFVINVRKNLAVQVAKLSLDDKAIIARAGHVTYDDEYAKNLDARRLIGKLPRAEGRIIALSFGINCERLTCREIAKVFNESKDWVSRKRVLALRKLREMVGHGN